MPTNNTEKTVATVGIILILILGIYIAAQYEKPIVPPTPNVVVAPIQNQLSSTVIPPLIVVSEKKHHVYNPSPSVPCAIGISDHCSAVFTVNGKRTDYSDYSE